MTVVAVRAGRRQTAAADIPVVEIPVDTPAVPAERAAYGTAGPRQAGAAPGTR
jgi:hypothetical protein